LNVNLSECIRRIVKVGWKEKFRKLPEPRRRVGLLCLSDRRRFSDLLNKCRTGVQLKFAAAVALAFLGATEIVRDRTMFLP